MCTGTKECILEVAAELFPLFNRTPYTFDDLYRIAERHGIVPEIDAGIPLPDDLGRLSLKNDHWIIINASPSIPRGDRLIDSFAKLFNFYYFHNSSFHNFHSCFPPDGEEYDKLCFAAGFLAIVPTRMLIDDLLMGLEPTHKYGLSLKFAFRRTKLLYNHLAQLNGRNSQQNLWKLVGVDGLRLVESYLEKLEDLQKKCVNYRLN
ncbi:MAG: hypothetical protein AB9873_13505 [Syntrophobacteraceae bacterium]